MTPARWVLLTIAFVLVFITVENGWGQIAFGGLFAIGLLAESWKFWVPLLALLVWAYGYWRNRQRQLAIAEYLETELKAVKAELKEVTAEHNKPTNPLAYGWYDDGWPFIESEEEKRAPLDNAPYQHDADDYLTATYVSEYRALPSPGERKEFLRRLLREGAWIPLELRDVLYADESAYVRAWAAGHLDTNYLGNRDYEPQLLTDSEPLVRAALWSNPQCNQLPWDYVRIAENWKERFRGMTQLEKLGLMRNPKLSTEYVVALLETPSAELNVSRKEHADVLCAAATNADLMAGSRRSGRDYWKGGKLSGEDWAEVFPPFEKYGRMWNLSLEKWQDEGRVPYYFLKYIQTTPKVKLATYNALLQSKELEWLRQEVIRSCDPLTDSEVLKQAWNDPEENFRKIVRERVGKFADVVGVYVKKSG